MFKVFVEYTIKREAQEFYLIYMRELRKREGRLELFEGTDQPGLFVEIWDGLTFEEYEELKRQRLQAADQQDVWEDWIEGGIRKLHMWHFTSVT